ncbi:MAG: hypothetical protein ABWY18_17345 [Tardiphaga sp.]
MSADFRFLGFDSDSEELVQHYQGLICEVLEAMDIASIRELVLEIERETAQLN